MVRIEDIVMGIALIITLVLIFLFIQESSKKPIVYAHERKYKNGYENITNICNRDCADCKEDCGVFGELK